MKTLKIKLPNAPEHEKPVTVPVKKSGGIGTLNRHDAIKGLLIAAVIGAGTTLGQSINDWVNHLPWNVDWENVARAAVSGALGYLGVNLLSPAKVIIKAKELLP